MNIFSRKPLTLLGFALMLSILPGCRATELSNIKKDPSFDPSTMHRVFVVAVVKTDRGQKMLEDEFVRQLQSTGREAVASYTLVSRDKKMEPEEWKSLLRANGWDTVVVSRLIDMAVVEKEYDAKLNVGYTGSGYTYYGMSYAAVYRPDSYIREQTAYIETKVFDVTNDREVWTAHSKTEIAWGGDPVPQIRTFVKLLIGEARRKR